MKLTSVASVKERELEALLQETAANQLWLRTIAEYEAAQSVHREPKVADHMERTRAVAS